MGNKASQLAEDLLAKSTVELRKGLPQVRAWLLKYQEPSQVAQGDSEGPTSDFDEAAELASDLSSKEESSSKASLNAEIAAVLPLPHSETDKSAQDVVASLVSEVQSRVLSQEANNSLSQALHVLIKGHAALQHSRLLESRSSEEVAGLQAPVRQVLPLSAVPLLWALSSPAMLQSEAGQTLFGLMSEATAGVGVGGLLQTDLKEAKSALMERLKAVKEVEALPTFLGVALGYADLPGLLEAVERLLEGVKDEVVLRLKPQLQTLLCYESNPSGRPFPASFGPGSTQVSLSPNQKSVSYGSSKGWVSCYLVEPLFKGSFYVEFLIESGSPKVEIVDAAYTASSGSDLSHSRIRYNEGGTVEFQGDSESHPGISSGDAIGVHVNFLDQTISLYRNGSKLTQKAFNMHAVRIGVAMGGQATVRIGEQTDPPEEVQGSVLLREVKAAAPRLELSSEESNLSLRAALIALLSLGKVAAAFNKLLKPILEIPTYLQSYGLTVDLRPEVFAQIYSILQRLSSAFPSAPDTLRPCILSALSATVSILELQLQVANKLHLSSKFAADTSLVDSCYKLMRETLLPLGDTDLTAAVERTIGSALDIFLSNETSRLEYILEQFRSEAADQVFGYLANTTLLDPMLDRLPATALRTLQTELISATLKTNKAGLRHFFWSYATLLLSNYCFSKHNLPLIQHFVGELDRVAKECVKEGKVEEMLWSAEHLRMVFLSISLSPIASEELLRVFEPLLSLLDTFNEIKLKSKAITRKISTKKVAESLEMEVKRGKMRLSLESQANIGAESLVEVVSPKGTESFSVEALGKGVETGLIKGGNVKITYSGQAPGLIVLEITEEEVHPGFYKANITKLRESLTYSLLKLASSLISQSYHPSDNKDPAVQAALSNPIISAGIRDNAWSFLSQSIAIPQHLQELAGPLLLLEEEELGEEMPNLGRSMSLMTEKESSLSQQADAEHKGHLGEYFGFLRRATQLPFLVEQSVFLESLIEGKGSPGQLWTHIHKLLGLDKKPHSRLGGAACSKAERMALAVLIKFSDLRREVEKLTLDVTAVPANVADLWRKANLIRSHLVQKQQEESAETAAERTVQLGILLLNSDFQASLSALGLRTQTAVARRRKSEDTPTLSKALSVVQPESKETAQALKMLQRLKQGSQANEHVGEPDSLAELILNFLKSSVDVQELAKEMKTRREAAVSRVVGLGLLHILQSKPKARDLVAKHFAAVLHRRHFLEGLGGIDPRLQECLRGYFFKTYDGCCEDFLALIPPTGPIRCKKGTTKKALHRLLGALAFPFKPSDFGRLISLRLQQTLALLLRCSKKDLRISPFAVNRKDVITEISVSSEGNLNLARDSACEKWVTEVVLGEKEGYRRVEVPANPPVILSYRCSKARRYLTALSLVEGRLQARFQTHSELKQPTVLEPLPDSHQSLCWAIIKTFLYSLVQAKGAETTHPATIKFTEVFLQAIYEQLGKNCEGTATPDLFNLVRGLNWTEPSRDFSAARKLMMDLEELTRGKAAEVNEMLKKYLSWDETEAGKAVSVETIRRREADAPVIEAEWLDAEGNFDPVLYLRASMANPASLPEACRAFLENSKPLAKLPTHLAALDQSAPRSVESEAYFHSLLWLLLLSTASETALRQLRSSEYLKLLLDLAFSKKHPSFNTLSFRILERILPTLDKPDTLDSALSPEVKAAMGDWLETSTATQSFLHLITALAGVLVSRGFRWSVREKTDMEDMALAADCCRGLLISALKTAHWREAFLRLMEKSVEELAAAASDSSNTLLVENYCTVLGAYHVLVGAFSLSEQPETETLTLLKQVRAPQRPGTELVVFRNESSINVFNYDSKDRYDADPAETGATELLSLAAWDSDQRIRVKSLLLHLVDVRELMGCRTLENTRVVNTHRAFWRQIGGNVCHLIQEPGSLEGGAVQSALEKLLAGLKRVQQPEGVLKKMREVLVKRVKGKESEKKEKKADSKAPRVRRDSGISDAGSVDLGGLFGDSEDEEASGGEEAEEEVKEEVKVEERKEEVKAETLTCLYRLAKQQLSPFIQVSQYRNSDFQESDNGCPTILSAYPASMDLPFTHELFRNVEKPDTLVGLTLQAAIGPTEGDITGVFGVKVGVLGLEIRPNGEETVEIVVNTEGDSKSLFTDIPKAKTICFRLHLMLNGLVNVKLLGQESSATLGPFRSPVFTGFSLADFSFYTVSQPSVTLRGLLVYEGLVRSEAKFWTEAGLDSALRPLTSRLAVVNMKTTTTDLSEVLGITGAGEELESQAVSLHPSLSSSLDYLLYSTPPASWQSLSPIPYFDYPVVDIRLFYRLADVPKTYEVAKYWLDGKLVGPCNETSHPGRKIIAYLKRPFADRDQYIEGLTMIPRVQEMNNYSYIGNLTVSEEETTEPDISKVPSNGLQSLLYSTKKPTSKLPSSFLTEIAILETSSTSHVNTPRGYIPVPFFSKENDSAKANLSVLNLDLSAQTSRLVVLAVSTSTNVLGFPARSLATKSGGKDVKFTGGMVDSYAAGPAEDQYDVKDYEIQAGKWSDFEALCGLLEIEEQLLTYRAISAIQSLGELCPFALCAALQSLSTLSTFLSIAVQKPKQLPAVFAAMLADNSPQAASLRKGLILETARQLYLLSTQEKVVNLMPTRLIESIHPYENNMNVQEVISIPGATSLLIEFDATTKTESGCDPLRFYRKPGNVDEICVYSGDFSNFKPLEVEGDTVYMKFTSDGSVVYWGYKFTVTPKSRSKPKATVRAPEYQAMCIQSALWVLEHFKGWQMAEDLARLSSPALINAVGLAMHNLSGQEQTQMITCFQSLIQSSVQPDIPALKGKSPEENLDHFVATLEREGGQRCENQWRAALEREARDLHAVEASEADVSPKMKVLAELLAGTKDSVWLKYAQTVFSLEGVCSQGARYYALLLSYAQEAGLVSLSQSEVIEAHYSKSETVKSVHMPGASAIAVSIDDKVSVEPHHSIAFSLFEDMRELQYSASEKMTETAAVFSSTLKGSYFTVTHEGKTAEYTNSTWQTIVVDKEFKPDQKVCIEFRLEECSDTDNIAFGFHEIQTQYNCNNCGLPGNGFAAKVWYLRGNGEFFTPASTNINQRMTPGMKITVEGDLKTKVFNWLLNDKPVCSTTIDTQRIMFSFTTYNSCKVTIARLSESAVLGTDLQDREYQLSGDRLFYAFPVNRAFEDWNMMAYRAPFERSNVNMVFTVREFEGVVQRVLLDPKLGHGRTYREVKIVDLCNAPFQFGITDGSEALTSPFQTGGSYSLSSTGEVLFAGTQSTLPSFRPGDVLSFLADSENHKITFAVNGQEVVSGEFTLGSKMYAGVCCHAKGQQFLFLKSAPEAGLLHLNETGKSKKSGLKLNLKPIIAGTEGLLLAKRLSAEHRAAFISFLAIHTRFSRPSDSDLCSYVDSIAKTQSVKCSDMKPSLITGEKEDLVLYPMLEAFTVPDLQSRFALILHINSLFASSFKLVDLSLPSDLTKASRMQKVIVSCREFLFYDLKHEMLQGIMRSTHCDSRTDISINRMRANALMLRHVKDSSNTVSVFAQAMKILNVWPHRNLRNAERVFTVNLVAESAGDAGGPYNEVITTMSEELMSDFVFLFVKSPNNVQNIGTNRDTFTINPDATSAMHMDMYLFLGKMFGVAIRTQNNMHLFLPPLFWKKLMLAPVGLMDLKGIDESVYQAVELLRNPAGKNVDAEQFKSILDDFTFTTKNSAGTTVDLKSGGSQIPVTPDNVQEYADLIERIRLCENDRAYMEIRKGMSAIIPLDILNLLSWSQVESLVCGAPTWDVDRVRSNTHYEGYSASDRVVEDFWKVVNEFTVQQKVLFLRFSWGRSRLPAAGSFKNFQLTKMGKSDPDHALPAAHTCFFTIDLPEYTTINVLRERLVFAITHCQAYDIDHLPDEIDGGGGPVEEEEEEE